jgi:hypothetical protein
VTVDQLIARLLDLTERDPAVGQMNVVDYWTHAPVGSASLTSVKDMGEERTVVTLARQVAA